MKFGKKSTPGSRMFSGSVHKNVVIRNFKVETWAVIAEHDCRLPSDKEISQLFENLNSN